MSINRFKAALTAVSILGAIVSSGPSSLASSTKFGPANGAEWEFCASEASEGCIASLYLTTASGQSWKVTNQQQLQDSQIPSLHVSCSVMATVSEDGRKQMATVLQDVKECNPRSVVRTYNGCPAYSLAILSASVSLGQSQHPLLGGSMTMVLRTGGFNPVFAYGPNISGTSLARTTVESNEFSWTAELRTIHKLNGYTLSQLESDSNSIANSFEHQAAIAIFPSEAYNHNVAYFGRPDLVASTFGQCIRVPLDGTWGTGNGHAFSLLITDVDPNPTINSRALSFRYTVYGPHFKDPRTQGGKSDVLNEARIQLYASRTFLDYLGCSDSCEDNRSIFDIRTSTGIATSGSVTQKSGGLLFDSGITHYSNPSPTFSARQVGLRRSVNRQSPLTLNDLPATNLAGSPFLAVLSPNTSPSAGTQSPAVTLRRGTRKTMSTLLKPMTGWQRKWTVRGGCSISGSHVKAMNRKGSCVLTLTENRPGKKKTRTVRISVT